MRTITKIACRTVGTAGVGLALYDAWRVGTLYSKNCSQSSQAKFLEKAYFDSRNIEDVSYISNDLRQKTFDMRTNNPLPSTWGKIKGFFQGGFNSLGNNLLTIACSSMALLSKGLLAKIGAVGVLLKIGYDILHNGFGVGKENPMK